MIPIETLNLWADSWASFIWSRDDRFHDCISYRWISMVNFAQTRVGAIWISALFLSFV